MIVYRAIEDVCSYGEDEKMRNEFHDYQNGIISVPNSFYNHGLNTFDYHSQMSYLHFFHFFESALQYISGIPSISWNGRNYIASYNIPETLLDKHRGFGFYPDSIVPIPALEYAIPFQELEDSFIQGEIIPYDSCNRHECSEEYKKYNEGNYEHYLENIDEFNKRLVKSYINFRRRK